jgi:hypothetical protein
MVDIHLPTLKIKNMVSPNGNVVANQFNITSRDGAYFQSYDSLIIYQSNDGKTYLDETYWDYSRTTGKYRNQFLGETKAETQAKIDSGEYKLANLN